MGAQRGRRGSELRGVTQVEGGSLAPSGQEQGRLPLGSVPVPPAPAFIAWGHLPGAWTGAMAVPAAGEGEAPRAARAVASRATRGAGTHTAAAREGSGSPFPRERQEAPCPLASGRQRAVMSCQCPSQSREQGFPRKRHHEDGGESILEPRPRARWERREVRRSGNVPEPELP